MDEKELESQTNECLNDLNELVKIWIKKGINSTVATVAMSRSLGMAIAAAKIVYGEKIDYEDFIEITKDSYNQMLALINKNTG